MVHTLMVKTIGNRLFLAPINELKAHRILNVGTGTGIWSMEMGDLFPNAEILGNDLSAIQPDWVSPNVKFEIDDVESEWVNDQKYDFIFSRYLSGSLADWPTYVKRLTSDDGSLEGTELQRWVDLIMDACRAFRRDAQVVPAGPWAKDPYLKDIGMCNLIQILDGLEVFPMKLLCGSLGWTKEEVIVLLAGVRNDLKSGKVHGWYHYNVVYGQKPEGEEDTEEG
ncbi:S-adenosyl-L-methionine-dependent methyltransferase [Colletotrichum cereale]|nr:S-adenosyl-L-methionine-dependent methyltransferase [Colletotrichum cereale]